MAAPSGCRFFGPIALVLCGPMVWFGSAAEPARQAADQPTAVVHRRGDAEHAGAPETSGGPSAEELVRAALKAEAAGNSAEREKLLRKALEKDPNYAPARWHLGYVRSGKEWLSWDEVQRRAASDPRIAEYRRRFDELAGTPAGELALARWCRDQGLEDHARSHWAWLLSSQPQNEEALKALGMRWHQGQLLTHEQIVAARRGERSESVDGTKQRPARRDWNKHWAPRVTKWQRMLREDNAAVDSAIREEWKSVSETDVLPAIHSLTATLMARSQWKKDEADYRALCLKWIAVLDGMRAHPATLSLAWHAVDHPMPEVRAAAADALKKRPKQVYLPLLIARMATPIEAKFSLVPLPLGGGVYEQTLFREGIDADFEEIHSHFVSAKGTGPRFDPPPPPGSWQDNATRQQDLNNIAKQRRDSQIKAAQATARAQAVAAAKSAVTKGRVEHVNAAIQERNKRAEAALKGATGMDLGAHPRPWYEWWAATCCDYFDVEKSSESAYQRPVYQRYYGAAEHTYIASRPGTTYKTPAPPPGKASCFPRGTVVWTLTGPAAIEKIKIGDRVLSQHPVTGELAYKPVVQTTTRKPESWARISLGPEVITATRGHAFLVAGEGWKMAKQLTVGMRLHTPSGSVVVDRLEDVSELKPFYERLAEKPDANAGDDLAYNLVVDESHTYFVGQHRVLVFDNLFAALANQAQTTTAVAR